LSDRSIEGGKAVAAICSTEDGETIIKVALDHFGGVHVLVANAGVLRDKSFTAMTEQEWDIIVAVHLRLVATPWFSASIDFNCIFSG
jgi:NAD(P)-dependent dehydrogenase (short-subunit alcohol dehydrogenase family)